MPSVKTGYYAGQYSNKLKGNNVLDNIKIALPIISRPIYNIRSFLQKIT